MKKSQLRQIIREEIKSTIKEVDKDMQRQLKVGQEYSITDPATGEVYDSWEFVGFDETNDEYLFIARNTGFNIETMKLEPGEEHAINALNMDF